VLRELFEVVVIDCGTHLTGNFDKSNPTLIRPRPLAYASVGVSAISGPCQQRGSANRIAQ
jgi:hypothetical protein